MGLIKIAEWNIELSNADEDLIIAGVSPLFVKSANLEIYWQIPATFLQFTRIKGRTILKGEPKLWVAGKITCKRKNNVLY